MRVACQDVSVWVPRRLQMDPAVNRKKNMKLTNFQRKAAARRQNIEPKMQDRTDDMGVHVLEEKQHFNNCCRPRMGDT